MSHQTATPEAPIALRGRGRPRGSKTKRRNQGSVQRLGYRVEEVCHGLGMSRSTINRMIKLGLIKVSYLNKTPIVPHSELQRLMTPR
jgi:hypothetical protein